MNTSFFFLRGLGWGQHRFAGRTLTTWRASTGRGANAQHLARRAPGHGANAQHLAGSAPGCGCLVGHANTLGFCGHCKTRSSLLLLLLLLPRKKRKNFRGQIGVALKLRICTTIKMAALRTSKLEMLFIFHSIKTSLRNSPRC